MCENNELCESKMSLPEKELTEEQIEHYRKVLSAIFGPQHANIIPSQEIQRIFEFRDRMVKKLKEEKCE